MPLKIFMFSWKFPLLVCNNTVSPLILGADFMGKTKMVLDLSEGRMRFKFAAEKSFPLSTILRSGTCLHVCRALDQAPLRCQLGKLADDQYSRMQEIVSRYPDVLTSQLGLTHLLEYEIQLKDTRPVRLTPYRLAPPKMTFFREHIKKLLSDGVIEVLSSVYSSPMFLVPKGEENFRAVLDYRLLN
jgi:hypothetical protein